MEMTQAQTQTRQPVQAGVATRCRYQRPDSTQTLREGLAEYYATNPNLFSPDDLANDSSLGELGDFFAAHDACHVLFALDTSLPDESLADTWTFFGTDVEWSELMSYMRREGQKEFFKQFFRDVGYARTMWGVVVAVPRMFKAIWRSRSMTRKWPLHRWEEHLDTPLCELRRDFGIRPV